MATFVQLINWTDQGVRTARETTARADAYAQLLERMGGRLKEVYWTLGQYDIVAIVEAPDDATITAASIQVAGRGNVRTTTLRGFSRDETDQILAKTEQA